MNLGLIGRKHVTMRESRSQPWEGGREGGGRVIMVVWGGEGGRVIMVVWGGEGGRVSGGREGGRVSGGREGEEGGSGERD